MTLQELYIKLQIIGISPDRYYLHGLYGSTDDNDKLAIVIKNTNTQTEYEVYYKEKGKKNTSIIFKTEDEACQYVYNRLKRNKEIEDKFSK